VSMLREVLKHLNTVTAREHTNTCEAFFKLSNFIPRLNFSWFSCLFRYLRNYKVFSISYIYNFVILYRLAISFYVLNTRINYQRNQLLLINPLKTKRRLLYLMTQSILRCEHFSSRL